MTSGSEVTLGEEQRQLRVGVKRQSSVILALIFKDLKSRIQGSKLGFIFVILEPLVFVSVISLMMFLFGQTEIYGVHVLLFGPTGIIPYLIFKRFLLKLSGAVGKADGLYDYPQVKPIDAIIASITLQLWLLFLASCVLMFLVWWLLDLALPMPRPLEAIGVLALYMVGCFGLGLIVAVYSTLYDVVDRMIGIMRRPILIISGVIWPIDFLPPSARELLAWNPLVHVIAYLRTYTLGLPPFPEADLFYVFYVAIALIGLGFITYYANRYRLVLER